MNTITDKVGFGCWSCRGTQLKSDGAVKTDDNIVYVTFLCLDCGESVPINVESMITELYKALIVPGSKAVN